MKKSYIIIIFLLGIVIALSVGRAILHNTMSTSGIFVSKTEQEIYFYKTQNAILSEELLAESSLTGIAEKAQKLDFTNKNTLMVLGGSKPLAVRP